MPKLVLIDDDPLFGNIMVRVAKKRELDIDYFSSLIETDSFGSLGQYDAAIVDYDLGNMTGIDIAEYLQLFFGDIPMILVSGEQRDKSVPKSWPGTVRCFIHKNEGYDAILSEALACIRVDDSTVGEDSNQLNSAFVG